MVGQRTGYQGAKVAIASGATEIPEIAAAAGDRARSAQDGGRWPGTHADSARLSGRRCDPHPSSLPSGEPACAFQDHREDGGPAVVHDSRGGCLFEMGPHVLFRDPESRGGWLVPARSTHHHTVLCCQGFGGSCESGTQISAPGG